MKQDKVERHPVPEDRLERFMGLVYSMVEPFGVDEVPEVMHYVELLGQAIERHLVESKLPDMSQGRQTADRRKFIAIFKTRYLSQTDLEYGRTITGIDGRLINQLSKVLTENGFDVDEFLTWFFDVFLDENPKFQPPTIKLSCSSFVIEKFLFEHREQIKQRRDQAIRKKEALDVIGRARVLARTFENDPVNRKKVVDLLKEYRDESIMIEKLRSGIEALEQVVRDQQKQAQGDGNVTV